MTSRSARTFTVGLSLATLSTTSLDAPCWSCWDSPYFAPFILISLGRDMSSSRDKIFCLSLLSSCFSICCSSNHLVCPPWVISLVFFPFGSCQGLYPFFVQYQTRSWHLL